MSPTFFPTSRLLTDSVDLLPAGFTLTLLKPERLVFGLMSHEIILSCVRAVCWRGQRGCGLDL